MSSPVVLLTGSTGFLGGATLTNLLTSHPSSKLLLLVRAENPAAAFARVRNSVGRFLATDRIEQVLTACQVLCGDLADRATYLQPGRDQRGAAGLRLDEVTHVLHLAANTSFRSVRGVRTTNILGALSLAHRMRRVGSLERFLYVGTAFICGERGTRVIREDDYPRPGVKHLVEYTASKAECELLLEATAPELPLVVARPSVVVGHTELGCLPSASLFWFYRAINALRRLPISPESMEDVIPVDYAAEALLFLLFKPQLRYRRYHVSAGEQSSVHWNEIAAAFSACEGRASDEPFQCADFATVERERGRLAALFGPGDEDHLLMALRLYYRFMETGVQVFDNQRLLDEGMSAPPAFTSYLKQCATLPDGRSIYKQMLDDE